MGRCQDTLAHSRGSSSHAGAQRPQVLRMALDAVCVLPFHCKPRLYTVICMHTIHYTNIKLILITGFQSSYEVKA